MKICSVLFLLSENIVTKVIKNILQPEMSYRSWQFIVAAMENNTEDLSDFRNLSVCQSLDHMLAI